MEQAKALVLKWVGRFWLGAALLLAAACASSRPDTGPSAAEFVTGGAVQLSVPDSTSPVARTDMRVAPLDLLEIRVFGVPELSGEYQVDPQGRMKFPLVGTLDVRGYPLFDLAELLEKRLGEKQLRDPDVTVKIKEAFARQVTVEGAVRKPGVFPIRSDLTLLQTIALAEGPSDNANPRRVVLFRTIEGKRMAAAYDLEAIRAGRAEDPVVFGNDVVVVDGSSLRRSYRDFLASVPFLTLFAIY